MEIKPPKTADGFDFEPGQLYFKKVSYLSVYKLENIDIDYCEFVEVPNTCWLVYAIDSDVWHVRYLSGKSGRVEIYECLDDLYHDHEAALTEILSQERRKLNDNLKKLSEIEEKRLSASSEESKTGKKKKKESAEG